MRTMLVQHIQALSSSIRRLLSTPFSTFLNILVIGIALSLPAGIYVLLQNVQQVVDRTAGVPQISLFLKLTTSQEAVAQISKKLKAHAGIAQTEFVSRENALKQLEQSTGLGDVINSLTYNPLPDAFVIYPVEFDPDRLEALRDEIQTWSDIERVQLDSGWARKLEAILEFGRTSVFLLLALLGSALLAVTFNTIRLQILTRGDEIIVAKLIGATDGFIRRPFLYFGLLQGLAGGIAAWLIVMGGVSLLSESLDSVTQLYGSDLKLQPLLVEDGLVLLIFSAGIGWLGAWLSVAQHLRRITPS